MASIVAAVAVAGLYNDARATHKDNPRHDRDFRTDLVTVPIDGSRPAVLLTPMTQKDERVSEYVIAGGSGHVLYAQRMSSELPLFSVPIDGNTAPAALDGAFPSAQFTPDSLSIVYLLTRSPPSTHNRQWGVNVMPVDGGIPLELHELFAPAPFRSFFDLQISPDGSHAVFQMPVIPTPTTLVLLILGGAGLLRRRARQYRAGTTGRWLPTVARKPGVAGCIAISGAK